MHSGERVAGILLAMHLAYVDDSGDSRHGTRLTALLVPAERWAGLLEAWLAGRRVIQEQFGVRKHAELHASSLDKGRGHYCETAEQERFFGTGVRAATGRIMLSHLAHYQHFQIVSVASPTVSKPHVYTQFIGFLEDWAVRQDTHLMVFYDGQQGLHRGGDVTAEESAGLWETAVRNATPYRRVHRELELSTRRIVEDVIMQDSRYSQLIQAVDLVAYGAYQRHRQLHPDVWGRTPSAVSNAIRAYLRAREHWLPETDDGVVWVPAATQGPPA